MKRSTHRILTTHTGSLPRPDDLVTLMRAKEGGELHDQAVFDARVTPAVAEAVRKQVEAGADFTNGAEMRKPHPSPPPPNPFTRFHNHKNPPLTPPPPLRLP